MPRPPAIGPWSNVANDRLGGRDGTSKPAVAKADADGQRKQPVVFDHVVDAVPMASCQAPRHNGAAGLNGHRKKKSRSCAGERYLALKRDGYLPSRGLGADDLVDKSRRCRCVAACASERVIAR